MHPDLAGHHDLEESRAMRRADARPALRWLPAVLGALIMSHSAHAAQPPLNANQWNFVLVPAFESGPQKSNNLSISGLNHALRFGQVLSSLTAGKQGQVRQVFALTTPADGDSLTPLQTIEPYAVLNNLPVKAQKLSSGDASTYNSPGFFIQQILANQPRGIYVMAMQPAALREIVKVLIGSEPNLQGPSDYLVASGDAAPFGLGSYQDQIPKVADYPRIPLPPRAACSQKPVSLQAKAPSGLRAYASQTVYLVRHVEAHPGGSFENGNYVCQGQWRALGATDILLEKMRKRRPDFIFTSDPVNIIDCGAACSYIRPSLTIAPFAIQHGLPLILAPFQWEDAADLAEALFNRESPYFKRPTRESSILVAWEHDHIEQAVRYLLATIYKNPTAAAQTPAWSYEDYDTIWELSTNKDGDLTFRNTCEGIPTAALPSTCPAFFQ